MSINTISAAQYRAAWRQTQTSASGNAFNSLLTATAGMRASSDIYQPSAAAQAMQAVTKEAHQLPDGRWATDDGDYDNSPFYSTFSPNIELSRGFEKWSASRSPLSMPDSSGLTAANLDYLRERYSGAMSEYERMEALQALMDIGAVSREEHNRAMGYGSARRVQLDSSFNGRSEGYIGGVSGITVSSIEEADRQGISQWYQQWENIHVNSPFAKFEDLNDILEWVGQLRAE